MSNRLAQVSGHITNAYGRGLLVGEVAIITGAGQGIGRSAALLFAKEGAKIVVSDIDQTKAEAVVAEIKNAGGEAIAVVGDVGADDFPKKIVDATVNQYGGINHIVNNAGFTYDKMLHTMPDDVYDIIMKIHVRAPFRLVRAAAPHLRTKSDANKSIINVSSTTGLHGNVGQANYAAAKAAVVGLTKTICKEWGPFGVRANTVAFGFIHTRCVFCLFLPLLFASSPFLLFLILRGADSDMRPYRLTADKADGAEIVIDGTKVALGIPGANKNRSAETVNAASDIPLRRGGTADEAASAMLFLASPLASYISGHTLEVTGGRGI